ncbi:MAG: hypothetical protein H6834_10005 [Planctomycetes bacterium]|nr:hypothetical protein [Planctomycetota bacterium]
MTKCLRFHLCSLALAIGIGSPGASAQDVLGAHRQNLAPVLEAWEDLSTWAGENQLQARRYEMLEALLHFEPDHKEARRILGYRKQKDGTWKASTSRRPPKDRNTEALAEFETRRRAIVDPFVERTLALVDANPDLRVDWKQTILNDAAALAPEAPRIRQLLGEVEVDGRWILAESALARTRRRALAAQAKEILETMEEPERAELPALANEVGMGSATCVTVDGLRTVGMDEEEAKRVARTCAAGVRFFDHAFSQTAKLARECTIYVIPNGQQKAFLQGHPKVAKDQISFLSKVTSTWAGFTDLGVWPSNPAEVRDAACRQCVDQMLGYAFGLSADQGWLVEGMGFYLCPQITGTRMTWFVVRTKYAGKALPLRDKLMKSETSWYEEAERLLNEKDRLDLHGLLARPLNALTDEDILLAFLVTAFVIEGHPPETASALMRAMAKAQHHSEAFKTVLDLDLPALEVRLRRFSRETVQD